VAHGVAGKTVSYARLGDLIATTPEFHTLAVSEVGQKLGADIVLYVQIDEFGLKDPSAPQLWKGRLQVTVRMVDVLQGRLWPKDRPAGYALPVFETPLTPESSEDLASVLTKTLTTTMAERIARLFYKHEVPHEGGWPGD
jgi:hypothetical protein